MAKKNEIEPGALYSVVLAKSIRVGRLVVNPSGGTKLRGDALAALIEKDPSAVTEYKKAE